MSNQFIKNLSKEQLQKLIDDNTSITDILKAIGRKSTSRVSLLKKIKEENINISHYVVFKLKSVTPKIPLEEIFKTESKAQQKTLKLAVLKENKIEYKCKICNMLPIWLESPLVLILDHINGINNDNRYENLRFLCPNCSSQLPTFAGRNRIPLNNCIDCAIKVSKRVKRCKSCFLIHSHGNMINSIKTEVNEIKDKAKKLVDTRLYYEKYFNMRKVKDRPSKETLESQLKEFGYTKTASIYKVSVNSIRNWLSAYYKYETIINSSKQEFHNEQGNRNN